MSARGHLDETVVVTGVSSFIGMHVARSLTTRFRQVIGTCRQLPDQAETIRNLRLHEAERCGVRLETLDLANPEEIDLFIAGERPSVWVHHAGYATGYSFLSYDLDLGHRVNVAPLERIYSGLKKIGCRGVIITGSCMEYSDSAEACREDDLCWPSTPYGVSKLTETIRSRSLSLQYMLKTRVARVFIPYGELDAPEKLISSAAASLLANIPIELSPCTQERDFIHINDLANGYLACIEDLYRDSLFEIYNLCSGEATSAKTVLVRMAQLIGADTSLLQFGRRSVRPGEANVCYGSNAKALANLPWKPRSLTAGLTEYIHNYS